MQNASAVAKEAYPQESGKCLFEPGSTACNPTMNSTTGGHQARGQGLEQAASNHECTRSSPNAAPKQRETGRRHVPGQIVRMLADFHHLEFCGCPFQYENNRNPCV
ncbi:hypothetical protein I79_007740 [Cricetulus griseus]|uniref:Uncharacterized protein n=1 Tax=Cricetulus griseus TaxID=10029 RepID=G3HBB5_CRIGR|nr:hypothetical protein I79_007740 [Cricetulus griseus]